MVLKKYLLIILIFLSTISYSQSDSINHKINQYKFTPQIAGGQIEATTFLYVLEFGGT
ncbi:MAG: hypothetical protein U5J96_05870 [Ignavibacteriaceae bacterium]|nr:hypothetical protein [Ignavibacteriaceae bacterium]